MMVLEEKYKTQLIDDICRFIRIPSRSTPSGGEEGELQLLIAEQMRKLGVQVRTFEADDIPDFRSHRLCHGPDRQYQGRPTVIAEVGPPDEPALLILSHSDTVQIFSPDDWTFDPFCGDVCNGAIRGRGCTDDKWGLATMLVIIRALKSSGQPLKKRLIFASTIDEENGVANGTLLLTLAGIKAEAALYLDGHEMKVLFGNTGGSNFYLRPKGEIKKDSLSRHAALVSTACQKLGEQRASMTVPPVYKQYYEFKSETINFKLRTDEQGPFFLVSFFTYPGEERSSICNDLEKMACDALGHELSLYTISYREPWFEPAVISRDTPLVSYLSESVREVLGREPQMGLMPKGDAWVLCNHAHIPTVWFGPQSDPWGPGGYHAANEYLNIDEVWNACQIAYRTVMRWLEKDR